MSTIRLLSCLPFCLAAACVTSPINGDERSDPHAPVTFNGYASKANATIVVRVQNKASGEYESATTATSRATATTFGGTSLYFWSATVALADPNNPATNCRFSKTCALSSLDASVRIRVGEIGYGNLVTFDEGGLNCVSQKVGQGTSWARAGQQCASGDSPVITLNYDMPEVDLNTQQAFPFGVQQGNPEPLWEPNDPNAAGQGVRVAIISSGIELGYTDLPTPVATALYNGTTSVDDYTGGGTALASIIAAQDNNVGLRGIVPGVELMVARVYGETPTTSLSNVANAIRWATDNGADIILVDASGPASSVPMDSALDYAETNDVLVVADAGDNVGTAPIFPAARASVLGVGAVDFALNSTVFGGQGEHVSLVAPGQSVLVRFPWGQHEAGYYHVSSSRYAAAHVAGYAALVASESGARGTELRSALELSATDLGVTGYDTTYGHGFVNAAAAAQLLQ